MYGKWTEFIKCTDYDSYTEYLKENVHKFRKSERSKSPNESPAHTPRKVLSKLNSLKMSSFRSLSIQEPEESTEASEGSDLPKCDSTYSIDIPHSVTIWEAEPRPPNSSEVSLPKNIHIPIAMLIHLHSAVLPIHIFCHVIERNTAWHQTTENIVSDRFTFTARRS